MLANLSSDAAPMDFYDGVPSVEMIGDSAEALASLLTFIYDPSEVNVHRWYPDTPLTASPANKYLVDGLRASLVQNVEDDWSLTPADWGRGEAKIKVVRSVKATFRGRAPSSKPFSYAVPEPASAIPFACEFGCLENLPAAFYCRARTRPTPVIGLNRTSPTRICPRAGRSAPRCLDLLRVLCGKQKLTAQSRDTHYTYTDILSPHCVPRREDATRCAEETNEEVACFGQPTLDQEE